VCPDVKYSVSTSRQVTSVLRGFDYGRNVRRILLQDTDARDHAETMPGEDAYEDISYKFDDEVSA
jgi:hypothetical protein